MSNEQQRIERHDDEAWESLYRDSSPEVQAAMARRRVETRGMSQEERLADLLSMEED
jgi:hypothetical protein